MKRMTLAEAAEIARGENRVVLVDRPGLGGTVRIDPDPSEFIRWMSAKPYVAHLRVEDLLAADYEESTAWPPA